MWVSAPPIDPCHLHWDPKSFTSRCPRTFTCAQLSGWRERAEWSATRLSLPSAPENLVSKLKYGITASQLATGRSCSSQGVPKRCSHCFWHVNSLCFTVLCDLTGSFLRTLHGDLVLGSPKDVQCELEIALSHSGFLARCLAKTRDKRTVSQQ